LFALIFKRHSGCLCIAKAPNVIYVAIATIGLIILSNSTAAICVLKILLSSLRYHAMIYAAVHSLGDVF